MTFVVRSSVINSSLVPSHIYAASKHRSNTYEIHAYLKACLFWAEKLVITSIAFNVIVILLSLLQMPHFFAM